jgi:DNA (cytosine-5)-methyltransferase 1
MNEALVNVPGYLDRPAMFDGCCGGGGAAMGYYQAGWRVIGVDTEPQPNYPFEFVQGDAVHYFAANWRKFEGAHASAPCQKFSGMSACRPGLAEEYPDLVAVFRGLFEMSGLPYVLENVPRSPLRPDLMLCGQMFGLELYRHRIFESNVHLWQPYHPKHVIPASKAGHWKPGTIMSVAGHVSPIAVARAAMGGIDWMTRDELAEAIPAQFSRFIGEQLLEHMDARVAA